MRTQKATLDKLQAELSKVVADGTADEPAATDVISRVEAARSDLGRTRAVMLYRMRRILTSDQHVKLQVLFDERERERRGHGRTRSPHEGISTMIYFRSTALLFLVRCAPRVGHAAQDRDRDTLIREAVARFEAESAKPRARARRARAHHRRRRGRLRDLRLNEAVELALAQNLDIAVERLSPQADRLPDRRFARTSTGRWPVRRSANAARSTRRPTS